MRKDYKHYIKFWLGRNNYFLGDGTPGKSRYKVLATGQISGQNRNGIKGEMSGLERRKDEAVSAYFIPAFGWFGVLRDGLQTSGGG
jgi:hypothetical protein